ncbi:response regulator, partial [bacterium]
VLVANESPAFCSAVERTLASEPFRVVCSHDGLEAMGLIEKTLPGVVLLDVALPTMYGFEICDRIRGNPALSSVKTILIASIYDKTRYKREPQSLYGADDYIEKHHIPDSLAAKIYRLVFGQQAVEGDTGECTEPETEVCRDMAGAAPAADAATQEEVREEIRLDEESKTSVQDDPDLVAAHEKARRLARIIVTDIALYNQKKVEEGIRSGTFRELLREEIREGGLLFERRVPVSVREGTSYLEDAFEEFIARKSFELSAQEGERPVNG